MDDGAFPHPRVSQNEDTTRQQLLVVVRVSCFVNCSDHFFRCWSRLWRRNHWSVPGVELSDDSSHMMHDCEYVSSDAMRRNNLHR